LTLFFTVATLLAVIALLAVTLRPVATCGVAPRFLAGMLTITISAIAPLSITMPAVALTVAMSMCAAMIAMTFAAMGSAAVAMLLGTRFFFYRFLFVTDATKEKSPKAHEYPDVLDLYRPRCL
jgi:hypothetical protein